MGDRKGVMAYDPQSNEWSLLSEWPKLQRGRSAHFGAAVCRDTVYAVGGLDGKNTDSIESLELSRVGQPNLQWRLSTHRLRGDRVGCSAIAVGRYVVIVGGIWRGCKVGGHFGHGK